MVLKENKFEMKGNHPLKGDHVSQVLPACHHNRHHLHNQQNYQPKR